METIIFKGNTNYEAILSRANSWLSENSTKVVVNINYFYDQIDEKHTVVVSYY